MKYKQGDIGRMGECENRRGEDTIKGMREREKEVRR